MTDCWWRDVARDPIHETAARWFARLQDPETSAEEILVWERWMCANPRHTAAFDRITETWEAVGAVSPQRVTELSIDEPKAGGRWLALAASVAGAAIVLTWTVLESPSLPWGGLKAGALRTTVGENRTLRLADGSEVTLGGNTSVNVAIDARARQIDLVNGEAFFTVAKDPVRPFRVQAGGTTVTAIGTAFNVRRSSGRTSVAVVEGRVEVKPQRLAPNTLAHRPLLLDSGQQATVDKTGVLPATRLANVAGAAAWRRGLLSFQREPLRDVLEEVNRYAPKPIALGDDRIGDLTITGTVMTNNLGEWIGSLERAFALRAKEQADQIVLVR